MLNNITIKHLAKIAKQLGKRDTALLREMQEYDIIDEVLSEAACDGLDFPVDPYTDLTEKQWSQIVNAYYGK